VVAYTADAKRAHGVPVPILEQYGTVAAETAHAMAEAVAREFAADAGLATTGVAGPSEVEGKPVGTFYIAHDFKGQRKVVHSHWSTTRLELKRRAVMDAMYLIWRMLEEQQEAHAGAGGLAAGAQGAGVGGAGRA
jgi:PncC family amidohydrolase